MKKHNIVVEKMSESLDRFYSEWDEKLKFAVDKNNPASERLAAINWIENQIGEPLTTIVDLEKMCDELRSEMDDNQ